MSEWPETSESLILRAKDPQNEAAWMELIAILPSDSFAAPPVSRLSSGDVVTGFPLVVAADGTLKLPHVEPIKVADQTLREAEATIAKAFVEADVLRKERACPILSFVGSSIGEATKPPDRNDSPTQRNL